MDSAFGHKVRNRCDKRTNKKLDICTMTCAKEMNKK